MISTPMTAPSSCPRCGGRLVPYTDVTFSDGEVTGVQCVVCGREPERDPEVVESLMQEQQRKPGQRNLRSPGIPQMMIKKGSRFSRGEYR